MIPVNLQRNWPIKGINHKCVLTTVQLDIQWWNNFMCTFNGLSLNQDNVPVTSVFIAAAGVTMITGFTVNGR